MIRGTSPFGDKALIDVYSNSINEKEIPQTYQDIPTNHLIERDLEKKIKKLKEEGWSIPEKGKYVHFNNYKLYFN